MFFLQNCFDIGNIGSTIHIYMINDCIIGRKKAVLPNTNHVVYHGTNLFSANLIRCYGILLRAQRVLTDFGKGFYVTPIRKQAIEWAYVKAKNPQVQPTMLKMLGLQKNDYLQHPDTKTPALLTCQIDRLCLLSLNGLVFPMPYEPLWHAYRNLWKSFVQRSRMGIKHHYDFVYGPIGRSHDGKYYQIKASKFKVQLSLNSENALQCLSNVSITPLMPEKHLSKKEKMDHLNDRSVQNNKSEYFINEIRNEIITISNCSTEHAANLIKQSWVFDQIKKQNAIIFHESPIFWAFFILFEDKHLWYKDYEAYLKKRFYWNN